MPNRSIAKAMLVDRVLGQWFSIRGARDKNYNIIYSLIIRGVNRMVRHDSIQYRFSYPAMRYLPIPQKILRYGSIRFDTGVYRSIY